MLIDAPPKNLTRWNAGANKTMAPPKDQTRTRKKRRSTTATGKGRKPSKIKSAPKIGSQVEGKSQPATDEDDETYVKEVIKKIQDGGKGYLFKEIIDRYRSQVAGIAYKMVNDYDDAKDITQMVFVKTFYNIKRFDTSKRFSTWLYRIAVNASIDYIRKFKKHKFEELDDVTEPKEATLATQTPEQNYELKQLREHILEASQKLNDKQRTAFVLKDLEGLDIDEIAQIMGMPQATVRWYLHRARKHLRSDLRRRFGPVLSKLGISGRA
jgi:RNA polymerase sigma-70 factor (ECF subfamily)